ncbi:T9SS type A sorting domain-containing protein [Flammeovirga yaeyamensis]|uniref:T9SS type A sorting domain-containing protein n=1 Tax=Flammeovirga yaeyamensis TaxID=367791 RepID=A0AAX1N4Y6_9BACT|nr:T9SS type A sorting domain-containing protein [Flammeovirga yaeyamensis]MBB3701309.1 agarase [Flammeovirga yaeyamensis]NMF38222.1 T9SS type A sorting domain-containing protein [Flammeovirga yaeyamensis]QWG02634.1 T9SS type A sorting domain-containing protein [Flammeovirga yaeyamensis]
MNYKPLLFITLLMYSFFSIGQDTVDINLNIKHLVGNSAEFDRSKYMVFHESITGNEWDSDEQRASFLNDYDIYLGRTNGAIVWEFNQVRQDPNKAGWPDISHMQEKGQQSKNNYASKTAAHSLEHREINMMEGGQMWPMYPNGQETTPSSCCSDATPWSYEGTEAVAEFYSNYLTHYFGEGGTTGKQKPKLVEVLNEPFVKANQYNTTNREIAEMHNVVAKRIKKDHPDVMVGGYTAAHPAFEDHDFGHWEGNWKMFIDVAGEEMDFFSFHLYDYVGDNTTMIERQRKGSNIEAIMDMINHYSMIKLGEVKPWSISEYGWFCPSCDGPYYAERDWYNVRSFSSMMMQLMERQDQIINAIPFLLTKASWAHNKAEDEYNSYGPRLLREIGEVEGEPSHPGYVYTDLLKFFELWTNVKGTRVDTKPTDFDLLSDAYINGNKLYLILSNLDPEVKKVQLNIGNITDYPISELMVKHAYESNLLTQLDTTYFTDHLSEVELGSEATMILEYTFTNDVTIDELKKEQMFYAETYLQPIVANQEVSFQVNNVAIEENGEAILRIGLGRDPGKSLKPTVKINGTTLQTPTNWKGDDQPARDRFFGVLEIPVDYKLLQSNNTVSVSFNDDGGHITTLILKTYALSIPVERSAFNMGNGDEPLGLENQLERLNVYPVPSDSMIKLSGIDGETKCSVISLSGKILFTTHQKVIDISKLNVGVYILNVETSKGMVSRKIIKK